MILLVCMFIYIYVYNYIYISIYIYIYVICILWIHNLKTHIYIYIYTYHIIIVYIYTPNTPFFFFALTGETWWKTLWILAGRSEDFSLDIVTDPGGLPTNEDGQGATSSAEGVVEARQSTAESLEEDDRWCRWSNFWNTWSILCRQDSARLMSDSMWQDVFTQSRTETAETATVLIPTVRSPVMPFRVHTAKVPSSKVLANDDERRCIQKEERRLQRRHYSIIIVS